MKRSKEVKRPDAILTSDWHLRDTTPICRTDDFIKFQWEVVNEIAVLQRKYDCMVIHAGDLFHHWKPSPELLAQAIAKLPKKFYSVYGNHDLPLHNFELRHKSGLYVLEAAGVVTVLDNGHYGRPFKTYPKIEGVGAAWHIMTYSGKAPWPGCTAPTALQLLEDHPEYDFLLTGDNHKFFLESLDDRFLFNPGSLTQQNADQIDHKPCVGLYFKDTNSIKLHYLSSVGEEAITREHIDIKDRKDQRYQAFLETISRPDWSLSLSFTDNLKKVFQDEDISKEVQNKILEGLE